MGRVGSWYYIGDKGLELARDWKTTTYCSQCGSCGCWWPTKSVYDCHSHDFWRMSDFGMEDVERGKRSCPGYVRRQTPDERLMKPPSGPVQRVKTRKRGTTAKKAPQQESAALAVSRDVRQHIQAWRDPGTVYLAHAQSRGDAIKIGKAVDPDRRLNQFRTVLPDIEFVKLWEVPNAGLLERTLHRHFKGSNVGGEWFEVNVEEVAKVVQSLMA